jgi:hypothetical protein
METISELFDWMVTSKSVRGSRKNDEGLWLNNSAKPLYFCPKSRIIYLEDNSKFLLKKETVCKAINLDKNSDGFLFKLPLPPSEQKK